ncbi:hypothetical protein Ancab_033637 [Ancistrocladus abbreviatus]
MSTYIAGGEDTITIVFACREKDDQNGWRDVQLQGDKVQDLATPISITWAEQVEKEAFLEEHRLIRRRCPPICIRQTQRLDLAQRWLQMSLDNRR